MWDGLFAFLLFHRYLCRRSQHRAVELRIGDCRSEILEASFKSSDRQISIGLLVKIYVERYFMSGNNELDRIRQFGWSGKARREL